MREVHPDERLFRAAAAPVTDGSIDGEVDRLVPSPNELWHLHRGATPRESGVIGRLQIKAHQTDQRAEQAFGLPQR